MRIYFYKKISSPVGELTLIASEKHLAAILWENDDPLRVKFESLQLDKNHTVLQKTQKQLQKNLWMAKMSAANGSRPATFSCDEPWMELERAHKNGLEGQCSSSKAERV